MKKSIALACILKNEVNNLPQLLESVDGCFDEIHLTDTGSTDGSIELITEYIALGKNPANSKIVLNHFGWIDDFAAARNASFQGIKTDYTMWLDLDDVLTNKDAFCHWRDHTMETADFWLITYNYASDDKGRPVCSFSRERVFNTALGFKWKYFVHEGVMPVSPNKKDIVCQYTNTWKVTHKRTEEDVKKDRKRNLNLFKNRDLDARMTYYHGKELFENQSPLEAFGKLTEAIAKPELEGHDRIMGLQYACLAAMQLGQFASAIQLAHQGLQLAPGRAEFFVAIADSYTKSGKLVESIPYYRAATNCEYANTEMSPNPLFAHAESYKHYPMNQLCRIYANLGSLEKAESLALDALKLGPHPESEGLLSETRKIMKEAGVGPEIIVNKKQTTDVLISCPPQGLYEWDEEIYKERGIGGSETATVEMSRWIHTLTGRRVFIFNNREKYKSINGVDYAPAREIVKYLGQNDPAVHIQWRHNMELPTKVQGHVWSHDLGFPGIDNYNKYASVICLSDFHSRYVQDMFGVPKEKIWVSRNGIEPERFKTAHPKVEGKVIFSSSPDRGIDRAMRVMDEVIKELPNATLHCFYGFDNMRKMGKNDEANRLEKMVTDRPYVKFHGNVTQSRLTEEMGSSEVWLYPTNFLETYCITAIEALCSGTYPVVRRWGALTDTLRMAKESGIATVLDMDCDNESQVLSYAHHVVNALMQKHWRKVSQNAGKFSWQSVAEEWVTHFGL